VETDTGWSRAAGEQSGRWRTILARAAGRATVPAPTEPEEAPVAYEPPAPYEPPSGYQPPAAYESPAQPYQPVQAYEPPGAPTPALYGSPAPPPPADSYGTYGTATPGFRPEYTAPPMVPSQPAPRSEVGWLRPSQQHPVVPQNPVERARAILRRNLGVPRIVAFANPKGGVHKTTATVLAAAAIGGARGRGVLAWDDNELRGTLGLRAGSARHAKTIRHLISELAEVELNTGPALISRIDDFLRHASDGSYDVLAGEEDPRFSWRLDPPTVRRVLDLLTRTHEVICVDTGNNVESGNWRTIMEAADQLVITTVPREDSAFSADWMMDVLVEAGREELVANAVTLVSMTTPHPLPMQDDLVRHFRQRNRAVCVVPYDPTLEQGGWIDHTVLQPATREAWFQAAAVIMEPFGR
jgi:MinD-like ATPase involved in chromosome partitioning or flagellar assembly